MAKTYNICVIYLNKNMLWNYYFYTQQPTYLLEFRCNFFFMPDLQPWGHSGAVPLNFLCPEKFVLNIHRNQNKNLAPSQFILSSKSQNLATGLLYASLHFQTCGILTSLSANISDFSPRIIFTVSWHRICYLAVAVIDTTLIDFITCVVIRSLSSSIISETN